MSDQKRPTPDEIPITSTCPECGAKTYFIQVCQYGTFGSGQPMKFMALYGCRPCFMVIPENCDQVYAAFAWVDQTDADKASKFIINLIDDFFKSGDGGHNVTH